MKTMTNIHELSDLARMRSLTLSHEVLFHEARLMNAQLQQWMPENATPDLEDRIARIRTAR